MRSISEIRHRIHSIDQTSQITRAMHLISIAKVKKGLARYESSTPYFRKIRATIKDILTHTAEYEHPFLKHRTGGGTAYIVISADKGLAGAYNHNVLEAALSHMQGKENVYIFTVGQMARDFFTRRGKLVDVDFLHIIQKPSLFDARTIVNNIISMYTQGLLDEVLVVYTHMKNSLASEPRVIKLLPVELKDYADVELETQYKSELEYSPSANKVLDILIPEYLTGFIYTTLIQSFASEHTARMNAMETATRNADKIVGRLTKEYNRARQAAITEELAEIAAGAKALKALNPKA